MKYLYAKPNPAPASLNLCFVQHCYPVEGGWLSLAKSAIKLRHQLTGFDCGVACLLYAEKCGQGQVQPTYHFHSISENAPYTHRKAALPVLSILYSY